MLQVACGQRVGRRPRPAPANRRDCLNRGRTPGLPAGASPSSVAKGLRRGRSILPLTMSTPTPAVTETDGADHGRMAPRALGGYPGRVVRDHLAPPGPGEHEAPPSSARAAQTRSSGTGLKAARRLRRARATPPFTKPHVPRLVSCFVCPRRTVAPCRCRPRRRPSSPARSPPAIMASRRPRSRATASGTRWRGRDVTGPVAGGEDRGEIRRAERPPWSRPPAVRRPRDDPGRPFPRRPRVALEAGSEARRSHRRRRRSPAAPVVELREVGGEGGVLQRPDVRPSVEVAERPAVEARQVFGLTEVSARRRGLAGGRLSSAPARAGRGNPPSPPQAFEPPRRRPRRSGPPNGRCPGSRSPRRQRPRRPPYLLTERPNASTPPTPHPPSPARTVFRHSRSIPI